MNETIINATNQTIINASSQAMNWTFEVQEIVSEIHTDYSLLDNMFSLIISIALLVLTYKNFKTTNKINKDMKFQSVDYFSKSFKFYFYFYIILVLIETLYFLSIKFNLDYLLLLGLIIGLTLTLILPWIARTYLLDSILFKHFEKDLPTKTSRNIFFLFTAFIVAIDFVLYIISYVISIYVFIIYTISIICVLLFYIYKKEGKLKKITKQIPQLTIILLIFLRFTHISELFVKDDILLNYVEYINSILVFIIYSFILLKLKKWKKVLEK